MISWTYLKYSDNGIPTSLSALISRFYKTKSSIIGERGERVH